MLIIVPFEFSLYFVANFLETNRVVHLSSGIGAEAPLGSNLFKCN